MMSGSKCKSKTVMFNGREVTVRELTVFEVRSFMQGMNDYEAHILDSLMDYSIPVSVVLTSTGLDEQDLIEGITPSELVPLYDTVLEVNSFLAGMAGRIKTVMKDLSTVDKMQMLNQTVG